ncbi:hypothetical protein V8F33_008585 [Rhypophila sp. PSN 637]
MGDENEQRSSSKGKGKQVDDSEQAANHENQDGLLPRIAKSAASLPSALFSSAPQAGGGLASIGGSEKAGSSRAAESLSKVNENLTQIRPNIAGGRETVKPGPADEHMAREEASFSAFLDSTQPWIPSQPPSGLEGAWPSHSHIAEAPRAMGETGQPPLSVAEQQERDGQDVVALLSTFDDGGFDEPGNETLSADEMTNLRRALFGEGEDSNQRLSSMLDNVLNFTPTYLREPGPTADMELAMHMGTAERDEFWQAWIGQWSRVLTEYQDEVWGDLGSLVEEARAEIKQLEEAGGPISGKEAPEAGCIPNFYSCASQGNAFSGTCCQVGQKCELDVNNNPACCPANAVCTGTAPASFVTPGPTKTAVSFVPNPYFSFPYVATYFDNPGDCSAAVSQCSANYGVCTSQMGGQGDFVVTIEVPGGGGTTFTGGGQANVGPVSATSICNSLSSVACNGLQQSMCTMTGTTAGGFYFGTGNAAARPTAACLGAMVAGVAGLAVMNGF